MSYEHDRINALEKLVCDQLMELDSIREEYASSLRIHGNFCASVTLAAFGHSDALTYDQILESLQELRQSTTNASGQPRLAQEKP